MCGKELKKKKGLLSDGITLEHCELEWENWKLQHERYCHIYAVWRSIKMNLVVQEYGGMLGVKTGES